MKTRIEAPLEQRYAQLDKAPLPPREAPDANEQNGTASGDANTQTSPPPNASPPADNGQLR